MEKLQDHYHRKLGVTLFPGTLNIKLEHDYSLPAKLLRLLKEEYGGSVSINIVPCKIFDQSAFILRTDTNEQGLGHHPKTIIEIAAAVKLRDAFNLKDGDIVKIEIEQ